MIVKRKGITLLTGEAGTGKTTLLRTVLESIPGGTAQFAVVSNPTLTPQEFLELALLEFGLKDLPASKAQRLVRLRAFLEDRNGMGIVPVLVIDEAHKLAPEVLEEVRLLTNFETAEGKLLQIVLAAQTELDEVLRQKELRQLKQRIAYRFTVKPLAPDEMAAYIRFRWSQAGAGGPAPFGEDTLDYLALFSAGIPRVMNAICDNALILAFSEGQQAVLPEHIVIVAKDLALLIPESDASGTAMVIAPMLA